MVGDALVSLGLAAFLVVLATCYGMIAYFFYLICSFVKNIVDVDRSLAEKEINYSLVEDLALKQRALSKGLDLDKELIKRKYLKKIATKKSFRTKLEEDVSESFFGKDVKEKKK